MRIHTLHAAALLALLFAAPAAPEARGAPAPVLAQSPDERDWETLQDATASLQARADAARGLAGRAKKGPEAHKAAAKFDELGSKFTTDAQLRGVLSECIATCDSPETQKQLAKSMGSGQPFERLFRLRAARGCAPGPVDDAALKLLSDKEEGVRSEALALLVHHKHAPAVKPLEALVKSGKDVALLGPAVEAVSDLLEGQPGWVPWEARLLELGRDENDQLRRSALSVLARKQDPARLELFLATLEHADWSSRAIALAWLARSNSKEAVAAVIARWQSESEGSRLYVDCGDTLRKMTGHPLADDPPAWAAWWEGARASFEFPKSSGPKTKAPPRPKSLSGTKVAEFYGIEINSQRVVFVIDVSGSMLEAARGSEGQGAPRIDVAKRELVKIVDALTAGSLFNIISFSDAIVPWLDGLDESADIASGGKAKGKGKKGPSTGRKDDEKSDKDKAKDAEAQKQADELLRSKAKDFIEKLNARGGTNIHDAMEAAFEDPSVDTIFLLSDGIPSIGKEVDPVAIREVVARWNQSRRLKINCVAIGMELPLLKWLADDSGGEYRYVP